LESRFVIFVKWISTFCGIWNAWHC